MVKKKHVATEYIMAINDCYCLICFQKVELLFPGYLILHSRNFGKSKFIRINISDYNKIDM